MPYRMTFALDLFNGPHERELSDEALNCLLECLFKIDIAYLRKYPNTPLLYQSGVVYMEEPPGQEDFQDIPTCLKMKIADCEDLACWRAAELNIKQNIKSRPYFTKYVRPNGQTLYHILVSRPDIGPQAYEDPSKQLGMR